MTKRKRVDELRWAVLFPSGRTIVYGVDMSRQAIANLVNIRSDEKIIRVRVTEVVKRRKKR